MARIQNWTKLKAAELWEAWLTQFEDEDEAIETAIWLTNRLVKNSESVATRRNFYSIKDEFIRRNQEKLIEGRKVREEERECARCQGDGCARCKYIGSYKRTLYVHNFDLDGRHYSFHSYQKPSRLSDEPGEDKEQFGGRFTDEELSEMSLPMSGFVKLLRYVARAKWKMIFL